MKKCGSIKNNRLGRLVPNLLLLMACLAGGLVQAEICFTGVSPAAVDYRLQPSTGPLELRQNLLWQDAGGSWNSGQDWNTGQGWNTSNNSTGDPMLTVNWTCEEIDQAVLGLEVVSLSLEIGSIYTLCTGTGVPVAIGLGVAGVITTVASMLVSRVPCDDLQQDAVFDLKIREAFKKYVCDDVVRQGLQCRPEKVKVLTL